MSTRRRLVPALCLLAGTALSQEPARPTRARTLAEDLQLFSQVLNQIRINHPDSVDTHRMLMAAIEAMVREADPHSYVIPAVRLDSVRQRAFEEGKLAPVPIRFIVVSRAAVVTSVVPGTHAARQDIRVGDELVSIDGANVVAGSPDEVDIALAGPKRSVARLTLRRRRLDGTIATLERAVKRERSDDVTAVPVSQMLDSITGYVRVTTFDNARVADDLHDAVTRLERLGMRRLLLDLRDNGGGLVTQAGEVAGEFLPRGAVVYSTTGRKEAVNKTVKVSRSFWRRERNYALVVLVNHGTASASELVAGALQDHDRALVAGRPTFGKALLMQAMPLTDGSLMMLVIGQVRTPCGRVVQRAYRGTRQIDYYRGAEADRDTAGMPSCKTTSGRTVYGGGGIVPDTILDAPAPQPLWLASLLERELVLRWAGSVAGDSAASGGPAAPDAARPDRMTAGFRAFVERNGGKVPEGEDANALLRPVLAAELARVRSGDAGYYAALLHDDPWIRAAAAAFDRAALLRPREDP